MVVTCNITRTMPIKENGRTLYSPEEIKEFERMNIIIDGSQGGLLVGSSHLYGGIPLIGKTKDSDMYKLFAEVEGWQYVLCAEATLNHLDELLKINQEFDGSALGFEEYEIPANIKIINTYPTKEIITPNKFLFFESGRRMIINKFSTKKYLEKLDEMNKRYCR